jgi:hypothetical protein
MTTDKARAMKAPAQAAPSTLAASLDPMITTAAPAPMNSPP